MIVDTSNYRQFRQTPRPLADAGTGDGRQAF